MLAEGHDDESREQRARATARSSRRPERGSARSRAGRPKRRGQRGRPPDGTRRCRCRRHATESRITQVGIGESQQHQADQRESHAGRQDEIQRPLVQAHPDQRLKERGGELEDEGDEADLEEAQREALTEDRIERRGERLHHVVEHMRGAERDENAERRRLHGAGGRRGGVSICRRSCHGLVPGRRAIGAPPKKFRPPRRPLCQCAHHMGASRPHCQF